MANDTKPMVTGRNSLVKFNRDGTPCKLVKRSKIWEIFTIVPDDPSKAICGECDGVISRGGGTGKSQCTTNLWKHLQNKHAALFQEVSKYKEVVNRSDNRITKVADVTRLQHPENSKAWELFSVNVTDPSIIKCLECDVEIMRPPDNATTDVLWYHIMTEHAVLYQKCVSEAIESVVLSPKGKRSSVWSEFTQHPLDFCKVICNTCDAVVSRGTSKERLNTTNMRRHLMGNVHLNVMRTKGLLNDRMSKRRDNTTDAEDGNDNARSDISSRIINGGYHTTLGVPTVLDSVNTPTQNEDDAHSDNSKSGASEISICIGCPSDELTLKRRQVDLFHTGLIGTALYEQQKQGVCCDFSIVVRYKAQISVKTSHFRNNGNPDECLSVERSQNFKIHRCIALMISRRMRLAIEAGSDKLTLIDIDKTIIPYFIEIAYTGKMELIYTLRDEKLQELYDLAELLSAGSVSDYLRRSHPNILFHSISEQRSVVSPASTDNTGKTELSSRSSSHSEDKMNSKDENGGNIQTESTNLPRVNKRKNYIPVSNGNDIKSVKLEEIESLMPVSL